MVQTKSKPIVEFCNRQKNRKNKSGDSNEITMIIVSSTSHSIFAVVVAVALTATITVIITVVIAVALRLLTTKNIDNNKSADTSSNHGKNQNQASE